MNPVEINQKTLDFAMRVHNNCMDSCIEDGERYRIHSSIRELMVSECHASARHAYRWQAHITRFNVPYPIRIRFRREREARKS